MKDSARKAMYAKCNHSGCSNKINLNDWNTKYSYLHSVVNRNSFPEQRKNNHYCNEHNKVKYYGKQ